MGCDTCKSGYEFRKISSTLLFNLNQLRPLRKYVIRVVTLFKLTESGKIGSKDNFAADIETYQSEYVLAGLIINPQIVFISHI